MVDDLVIVELKAAETLHEEHVAQLINYLKATKIEVGLLLNFGKKAEVKRKSKNKEKVKFLHTFLKIGSNLVCLKFI